MKKNHCLLIAVCIIFTFSACDNHYIPAEGEIEIEVIISQGSPFEYSVNGTTSFFLPYPINLGQGSIKDEKVNIGVIGQQISPSSHLFVKPFAQLKYIENGERKTIYLAIPGDKKYTTIEIKDYNHFITEFYGVKKNIEDWYQYRHGLGAVDDITWNAFF